MKKIKRFGTCLLALIMAAGMLAGCSGGSGAGSSAPAESSAPAQSGSEAPSSQAEAAPTGERQKIEFWFHSADETSNALYKELIDEFNASQDQYEAVYTGIAFADFNDSFTMAVVTDTMPDVVSVGFSNVMTYVEMNALIDMKGLFEAWPEHTQINQALVDTTTTLGNGAFYGVPYAYNQEVSWYNSKMFGEKSITPPLTQADFLSLAEQYADPANDSYFFSLRAVRPYDNLVGWLFTYTDGAGYNGSYFDETGKCILDNPAFAEAMDAYASLYKNNWVSGDSVNNNFNEIVAEFGSGTSMYIMHNSSSLHNHQDNLGEGNFGAVKPLENSQGRYFTSALQPNMYSICRTKGDDGDYTGAMELIKYLAGPTPVSRVSETLGRVPVNSESFKDDWAKDSDLLNLCMEIVNDENFIQVQNPYWLSTFTNFIQNQMTTDFQAVLLGDRTSADVLKEWSDFLSAEQADYLQRIGA